MTSWMAERDRLLAQTKAFVKEVAAAHPKVAPDNLREALRPGMPRGDAGLANVVANVSKTSTVPDEQPASDEADSTFPATPPSDIAEAESQTIPAVRTTFGSGESGDGIGIRSSQRFSQPPDVVLTIPRVATSERDDIAIRVSHFREHQRRLSREREQFSEQMRARIKSLIGEQR